MLAHTDTDLVIGILFLGLIIGLLFGLVIHDAFRAWDEYREDDPRKPW